MFCKVVRFVGALAVLVFVFASIQMAAAAEAAGMGHDAVASASQEQNTAIFALEQFYRGTDNALKEFAAARSDHAAIALNIGQCYYEKIGDPIHWSPSVRAMLLFELDEHLMHTVPNAISARNDGRPAYSLPVLNPFHTAAISFSDRISRDRLEVRRELEDSRSRSKIYQILILSFGACATIFVSIRAVMQGNTSYAAIVGVVAIIFSAAGAAVSSMSSFDGSQAIALRDQRTLSQLQQLHWRVASDVLKKPNLCKEPTAFSNETIEVVDAWRTRLEAILDSAVETIAKPGDLSSGIPANPPSGGRGEQARTAAIQQ